jgi:hypothetical protein
MNKKNVDSLVSTHLECLAEETGRDGPLPTVKVVSLFALQLKTSFQDR